MKTILITGASTGIGKAFVQNAVNKIANVKIIILTKHPVDYEVPKNTEIYLVDLTDHQKVARIIKKVLKKNPIIDVLVNNAGNGWRGMIEDTTIDEAKKQLDINVWALMHIINLVLPAMRRVRSGHIINISSVAATINYPTIGYYSATKAFVEKISEVLAVEVAPWNINVSLLAPGAVKTKFGHNMINIKQYNQGPYKDSYRDWAHKFEVMFQKPLSSDEAALNLIHLIEHPRSYSFLTKRDAFYCYAKKLIPRRFFNAVLLQRYMNL